MIDQAARTVAWLTAIALVAWTFVLPVTAATTPAAPRPNVYRPTDERQATTTTTTTPPLAGDCEAFTALAAAVGWPESELETVTRVIRRESRCDNTQHNPLDDNGGSYGEFQVNGYWCRPNRYWPTGWLQDKRILGTCEQLFDARTNALAALAIFRHSGWHAWGMK